MPHLPLRPVVRVGVGHVGNRVQVKRTMAGEQVPAMLVGESSDLFLQWATFQPTFSDSIGRGPPRQKPRRVAYRSLLTYRILVLVSLGLAGFFQLGRCRRRLVLFDCCHGS